MVSLAAANEQLAAPQLMYDHRLAVVWWGVGRECGAVLVGEFGVV